MSLKLSFSAVLTAASGRPSGFDYMRIILAVSVMLSHVAITTYGMKAHIAFWGSPVKPLLQSILPMFFALSGFLVAGSMERSKTLIKFVGLRAIRIYPALSVEVLISAILLGPLLTTLPLAAYFSSPVFFRYLFNVTGHISYALPGVFANNPYPNTVNDQLWTVPFELYCYIVLSIMIAAGVRQYPKTAPLWLAGIFVTWLTYIAAKNVWEIRDYSRAVGGIHLVTSFLAGLNLYLFRDRVPYSKGLAFACFLLAMLCFGLVPKGAYLGIFPMAYVTVFLGLTNAPRIKLIQGADYSYGVFLYGFAIQQATMALLPWAREWYWNIVICVPIAAGVAAISWILVERPAMGLKRNVDKLESAYLTAVPWAMARLARITSN